MEYTPITDWVVMMEGGVLTIRLNAGKTQLVEEIISTQRGHLSTIVVKTLLNKITGTYTYTVGTLIG